MTLLTSSSLSVLATVAPLASAATGASAPAIGAPAIVAPATWPGHPRLLPSASADASDPLLAKFRSRLLSTAEGMLARPSVDREAYLKQGRFLDASRETIAVVTTCVAAWEITGDARFRDRALTEARVVSRFADWHPAHFLDTAEMTFAVAFVYDRLFATLSSDDKALLREAIVAKGLKPGLKIYESDSWWAKGNNNWNQVCNAGLLTGALAIAEDEPDLALRITGYAVKSLPRAIREYRPDGGYREGPVYWQYGTTYNVLALLALRGAFGKDFGLSDEPAFRRTADYYAHMRGPSGYFFNYADCPWNGSPTPAFNWLAHEYGAPEIKVAARREFDAWMDRFEFETHECGRFLGLYRYLFPVRADGASADPALDSHFHGAVDIATMRGSWTDPDTGFVGVKAGRNDVPHGHLDAGSFVYDACERRWVADPGRDDYTIPGYFGAGRWKIFRLTSHAHAILAPDGLMQSVKASAVIEGPVSEKAFAETTTVVSGAYPGVVASWKRTLRLDRASAALRVTDEVSCASGTPLDWHAPTTAKVEIDADDPRRATMFSGGKKMAVRIVTPGAFTFSVQPFPDAKGGDMNGLVMLHAQGAATGATTTLTVEFTPVR